MYCIFICGCSFGQVDSLLFITALTLVVLLKVLAK